MDSYNSSVKIRFIFVSTSEILKQRACLCSAVKSVDTGGKPIEKTGLRPVRDSGSYERGLLFQAFTFEVGSLYTLRLLQHFNKRSWLFVLTCIMNVNAAGTQSPKIKNDSVDSSLSLNVDEGDVSGEAAANPERKDAKAEGKREQTEQELLYCKFCEFQATDLAVSI